MHFFYKEGTGKGRGHESKESLSSKVKSMVKEVSRVKAKNKGKGGLTG